MVRGDGLKLQLHWLLTVPFGTQTRRNPPKSVFFEQKPGVSANFSVVTVITRSTIRRIQPALKQVA
jgi:hypothetical protein